MPNHSPRTDSKATIPPGTTRRAGRPATRSPDAAGVRTLLMGITLLKTIARLPEPANLSDIARRAALPVSRAHRYLTTLVQGGMLSVDPATGLYTLGPAAVELGVAAMSNTDALQIATNVMRRLTARVSLVSLLSVWGTNGPTVVRWEQGKLEAAVRVREGINLSLLTTAAGQVFLAYLDPRAIASQLDHDLRAWNRTAPPAQRFTAEKVKALQQAVREQGLACAIGIRNPLVAAISAPVFDRSGLIMSLTLAGIQGTFDTAADGEPARCLKEAAREISNLLGGGVFVGAEGESKAPAKRAAPSPSVKTLKNGSAAHERA
jgi:DNA-binding IclR family transcriptional regulator